MNCDVFRIQRQPPPLLTASLCQSYHSVVCHDSAHIGTDECGAPEFLERTKILTTAGDNGKLDFMH